MRFNLFSKATLVRIGVIAGAASLVGVAAIGVAQALKEPTIEELVNNAQKRADAMRQNLGDLTGPTDEKVKTYQAQAQALAQDNHERVKKGLTYLGQGYTADSLEPVDDNPDGVVYVAVSLSMPVTSLRQLVRDAHKAHVQVVIQGPVHGSFKETFKIMTGIFSQDEVAGMVMDPRVFQQYHIDRVPAFVAAPAPVENCEEGIDCVRGEVPHDIIRGNVTLGYALKQIADRGDAAPLAAKQALARMED